MGAMTFVSFLSLMLPGTDIDDTRVMTHVAFAFDISPGQCYIRPMVRPDAVIAADQLSVQTIDITVVVINNTFEFLGGGEGYIRYIHTSSFCGTDAFREEMNVAALTWGSGLDVLSRSTGSGGHASRD